MKLLLASILVLSVASSSFAQRTITVFGEGSVPMQADAASIRVSVSGMGTTATQLFMSHNAEVARVKKALENAGIPSKDIVQERFNLIPNLEYSQSGPRVIGYRIETPIVINIPDIQKLPQMLDLAQSSGASSVSPVNFTNKSHEGMREQASKAALKDARERAESLAKEVGGTLGEVISISDVEESAGPMSEEERERGGRAPAPAPSGNKAELKVVFQLK